jgi:predicted kinase
MAGAGKTTLAKQLESTQHALRLCPDEWIKTIIKDENDRIEMDRLRDPVEKLQWNIGQKLLRLGLNVILENGFWSKEERMEYRDIAKGLGANVVLHYLDVPKAELWRRIQKRNAELPDDSFRVAKHELEEWLSWFTPPDDGELKIYDGFKVHKP